MGGRWRHGLLAEAVATAVASAVAVGPIAVAGCAAHGSGQPARQGARERTRPAIGPAPGRAVLITALRLAPSGFGLVGLTRRPDDGGSARLLETTDFGATFRVISPRTGRGTFVDGVWALGRSLIWFDTFNPATVRERLYWTSNGGRSWSSAPAPGHSMHAGATSSIQFVTARDGWLTATEPTAPGVRLYRTVDGGARWRLLASGPPGPLHQVAPVEDDPRSGFWQAGGLFSDRLEHSADGRHWHGIILTGHSRSAAGRAWYSLPGLFGPRLRTAVAVPRRGEEYVRWYASRDAGRTWARVGTLVLPGGASAPAGAPRPVGIAFASPRIWWVLAPGPRPRLYSTTDGGARWRRSLLPGHASAWQIAAADARHCWVLVTARTGATALAVTADAGRDWRLVRFQPGPAAG